MLLKILKAHSEILASCLWFCPRMYDHVCVGAQNYPLAVKFVNRILFNVMTKCIWCDHLDDLVTTSGSESLQTCCYHWMVLASTCSMCLLRYQSWYRQQQVS